MNASSEGNPKYWADAPVAIINASQVCVPWSPIRVIGLSEKLLHQFVEYMANRRMKGIGLEPRYIDMVFEILRDLQQNEKKTIILVEQNAKKGLEFADIGYVLVSGQTAIAGKGDELLNNPDVGRLFLGG